MNKIDQFESEPKSALLQEIEKIIDEKNREKFEQLKADATSLEPKDIFGRAKTLVDPEKLKYLESLKIAFDDQNPLSKKVQCLLDLYQEGPVLVHKESIRSAETQANDNSYPFADSEDENTRSPQTQKND